MSEQPRGAVWQAVVAASVMLVGTGPFAQALLMVAARDSEEGGFGGLARLIQEGGGWSYVVLLCGGLASLVSAVLAALAVRSSTLSPSLAGVPFVLTGGAAMLGVVMGMRGMLGALAHVNPLDRPLILMGGTGEVASLNIQALAFSTAGALLVAAVNLFTITAPGRGARLVTFLGMTVLGLSFAASFLQSSALRGGFTSLAMVSPADRMTILVASIEDWSRWGRFANGLLLGALLVAIGGAVALAARGARTAGIGVAAGLVVTAVGVRGLDAMSFRQMFAPWQDEVPTRPARVTLDGTSPRSNDAVTIDDVDTINGRVARAIDRGGSEKLVGLDLHEGVSREQLLKALTVAHYLKSEVELVGQPSPRQLPVPRAFEPVVRLLSALPSAVPVRVLFAGEACEDCKGTATLSDKGLHANGEDWTQSFVPSEPSPESLPGVEFDWSAGAPNMLVQAALIARANGHVLVVRIPAPETPPELPDL